MRWSKKARSSCLSFSNAAKVYFSKRFRQRRIVREAGECDLRLDHPELGEVAAGSSSRRGRSVRKCRPWSCEAIRLDSELPRDRQKRLAAEEILPEIDLALGSARQVGEIQGRHPDKAPAPSASEPVMIGVLTQKNPFSSKNRWIAFAWLWRTRVAAPIERAALRRRP